MLTIVEKECERRKGSTVRGWRKRSPPTDKNYDLNCRSNSELLQHRGARGLLQLNPTAFVITVRINPGKYALNEGPRGLHKPPVPPAARSSLLKDNTMCEPQNHRQNRKRKLSNYLWLTILTIAKFKSYSESYSEHNLIQIQNILFTGAHWEWNNRYGASTNGWWSGLPLSPPMNVPTSYSWRQAGPDHFHFARETSTINQNGL